MATLTSGRLSELVQSRVQRLRKELRRAGGLFGSPARLDLDGLTLATASDQGPKPINQDSVLFFEPEQPSELRWAAAIADGVSSSLFSKLGSSLACHAALAALKRRYCFETHDSPSEHFVDCFLSWTKDLCSRHQVKRVSNGPMPSPVRYVDKLFQAVARQVGRNSEAFRPADVSESSWSRILRDGRFLQTTLMVAWQVGERLYLEGVGDGGFMVQLAPQSEPLQYHPSSAGPVQCVGPHGSISDHVYRVVFDKWHSLAFFTDGVTPLMAANPGIIEAAMLQASDRQTNPAAAVLGAFFENSADLIDDNITLLLAERIA